ncbi:MAG TPA: tetratricopeptide repeat protein [Thermodesulfovibrionales bacterium]|nr:tetratricopeptide repeat protein [Thermodesulfovibrionales bacterium]
MNGRKLLDRLSLTVFVALVFIIPLIGSCKKEEAVPARKDVQETNPYSNESVFAEVKKKLQENPQDVDLWYRLADLYDRNGQYAEAVDTYKKVVEMKPDMGYAYFKMGTAYDRLNRPADAVPAFEEAIRLMPTYAAAYNNLGIAYGKLGKISEEIRVLKKATELRPRYASAHYNLGIAYLKSGNKKAALREYESLKDTDSSIAEALQKEINAAP